MSKKAFVDLGHGGNDPGAVGNGLRESDIVLMVGKRVKYHIARHGVDVMLSREDDRTVSLSERTRMANNWGADVFVSIHCNSATATAHGVETYCYKFKYRALADRVHNRILADTSLYYTNRGVKEANFHVLRESYMDAALVEMAFISNTRDAELLKTKQEEYAIAIAKGILDYLEITWQDEVVDKPSIGYWHNDGVGDIFYFHAGGYAINQYLTLDALYRFDKNGYALKEKFYIDEENGNLYYFDNGGRATNPSDKIKLHTGNYNELYVEEIIRR